MALIKSKVLALYLLRDELSADPYYLGQGANIADALADAINNNGAGSGDLVLCVNSTGNVLVDTGSSNAPALLKITDPAATPVTFTNEAEHLEILGAATNSTLDIQNTVNEVVARDGAGSSDTYIVSGAQNWSFSADGFFTNTAGDTTLPDLFDISRNSQYVVCRFDTNIDDGSSVQFMGQGLIESCSISGGFDDNITYNVSVSGYGKLYKF